MVMKPKPKPKPRNAHNHSLSPTSSLSTLNSGVSSATGSYNSSKPPPTKPLPPLPPSMSLSQNGNTPFSSPAMYLDSPRVLHDQFQSLEKKLLSYIDEKNELAISEIKKEVKAMETNLINFFNSEIQKIANQFTQSLKPILQSIEEIKKPNNHLNNSGSNIVKPNDSTTNPERRYSTPPAPSTAILTTPNNNSINNNSCVISRQQKISSPPPTISSPVSSFKSISAPPTSNESQSPIPERIINKPIAVSVSKTITPNSTTTTDSPVSSPVPSHINKSTPTSSPSILKRMASAPKISPASTISSSPTTPSILSQSLDSANHNHQSQMEKKPTTNPSSNNLNDSTPTPTNPNLSTNSVDLEKDHVKFKVKMFENV
eukprot:gene4053-5075_t